MGNYLFLEQRLQYGSNPSSIDVNMVLKKRLNDCTNFELIVLCNYYKVTLPKVVNALLQNPDFNGACFEDLYQRTTNEAILLERLNLVKVVDEYVKDMGQSKFFIYKVAFKKFSAEKESSFEVETRNQPTTSTFLRLNINSTSDSTSSSSLQSYDAKEISVTPIPDSQLSESERKGIKVVLKKKSEKPKKGNGSSSTPSCSSDEVSDIEIQRYVCEDRFMYYYFIRPTMRNNSRLLVDGPARLRVKLLVSSLEVSTIEKKAMSAFSDMFNANEYGIVHTGILIGEWKIDWFSNSLVRIECDSDKKLDASNTIAAIDVGSVYGSENVKQAFKSITKIVCNYNANKEYSLLKANCQHFISEILEALALSIPDSGSFKSYFEMLKRGETGRTLYVNETLARSISTCGKSHSYVGLKSITFKSRIELDRFCHFLDEIKYFNTEDGENDFWLLKAFDRSFVLIGKNETCLSTNSTGIEIKENGFFTTHGGRTDDSISKIKYSIKDVDFSDCTLKR